ncbi:MAG: hypothetical protein NXI12_00425 [Alphaproteobacteria bacterium]|nr:hypothetical protein [Alphaproteobacteria bacterium]
MSFVYQILGVLLILAGLPLFWTPIPVGLIMIAAGLALLISNSDAAREFVRARRARHPRFNAWVIKAEGVVPHPFDRILKRTDVDRSVAAEDEG